MRHITRYFSSVTVLTAVITAGCAGTSARAAEVALLAGHQRDSSVEISTASQWPPGNLPRGAPGDAIELENGASWALALNTDFANNPNQKIGLYYSRHDTGFDAAAGLAEPSLDIAFLHFTGTNVYPQSDRLSYFVLAGIGASFYKPGDATLKDVTRFSAQIGAGANLRLTDTLSLQLDARWLPTLFNSETSIFCAGGCTISVNADAFSQFQVNAGLLFRF